MYMKPPIDGFMYIRKNPRRQSRNAEYLHARIALNATGVHVVLRLLERKLTSVSPTVGPTMVRVLFAVKKDSPIPELDPGTASKRVFAPGLQPGASTYPADGNKHILVKLVVHDLGVNRV